MEVRELTKRPVVTCPAETTLVEAARMMRAANVGSVVVTGPLGVAGIATDRDIVMRGVAEGLGPEAPIGEVMTRDVQFVYEDTDVLTAARRMAARGCRRLPVLGPDNGVRGVIALDDLIVLFSEEIGSLADTVRSEVATAVPR